MTESGNYHAFLLRVWREQPDEPWRASLEDPHTGERVTFAGAERLLAYLRQTLDEPPAPAPVPPPA